MDDLISRAAAIEAAFKGADDWDGGFNPKYLNELAAVDAAPVVHGRWIQADLDRDYVTCSCCKANDRKDRMEWTPTPEFAEIMKYCPECGAKMDKESE